MRILVTGATGYVGGRLIPRLIEQGHHVTALVRDARRLTGRTPLAKADILEADLTEPGSLEGRLEGFDAAYFLVHALGQSAKFHELEYRMARNFAAAAHDAKHVIYLGGLQPAEHLSQHLKARRIVGEILRDNMPERVTEFRAGPIIGSGSASFEMVRYLTERLPIMVTPRWVNTTVQPIAIRDVLSYLIEALHIGPGEIVEVGSDAITFRQMMQDYAAERGLTRRVIIATPFLAPALAARWVGLVTPIPNRLAIPLVRGMLSPILGDTRKARDMYPQIRPIQYRTAVNYALNRIEKDIVETRWSDSLGASRHYELADQEGLIREVRQREVSTTPEKMFEAITSLGGDRGWLTWAWAWRVRGWLDQAVGGPGLRRGRRHPSELAAGETVDFWRVERIDRPHVLRLRAEMKLPGKAWLQWEITPGSNPPASNPPASRSSATAQATDTITLTQTALFEPKGLPGFAYWYALYPFHLFIFSDMIDAIAKYATQDASSQDRS